MNTTATSRVDLVEAGEIKCDEASSLLHQGDFEGALDHYNEAEQYFLQAKDQRWLNFLRHEKLQLLQQMEQFQEALDLTREIIEGYRITHNKSGLALVLIHQSDILMAMGNKEQALASLNLAYSIVDTEKLLELKGYLQTSLAVVYQALGDRVAAIEALQSAIQQYDLESSPAEYAWCLHQLGMCYRSLCDFNATERYLTTAYQAYSALNDYESQHEITEVLREIFSATNQLKKLAALN